MSEYDIDKLNEIIHGRLRLGVMAYLADAEAASFTELATALNVTAGNLSIQMRKLEGAGYIDVEKAIVARKMFTTVRLTQEGRKAFSTYLDALSDVLGGSLKT